MEDWLWIYALAHIFTEIEVADILSMPITIISPIFLWGCASDV